MGEMIEIAGPDGTFGAYASVSAKTPAPGLVVIQEIFGVNAFLKKTADEYAALGFSVLVPDLFWRLKPGVDLDPANEADFQAGLDLMGKFDLDLGVKDIQATLTTLRGQKSCNGKVGAVGFCLGGLLAYLTAARTDSDATVGYYGVNIQNFLGEGANIAKPLILHMAGSDGFVPKQAQDEVKRGLAGNGHVAIYDYPGRDHGFARSTDARHYHEADAGKANARTLELFNRALV